MTQQPLILSPRRGLSADALVDTLGRRFVSVADSRRQASCDCLMAGTLTKPPPVRSKAIGQPLDAIYLKYSAPSR